MKIIETLDQLYEFFDTVWAPGGQMDLLNELETIDVADVVQMCLKDPAQWESILSEYPYIFNIHLRVAFLPMGSPLDNKFINMIVSQNLTGFKFVKHVPEKCWDYEQPLQVVSVITDPLIRFCVAFRYTDNNIWYNTTGHPRGFFMSGTRVVREALEKDLWQFKNQIDIIKEKRVNMVIPYDLTYKFSQKFNVWADNNMSKVVDEILKCVVHPQDFLDPPWQWGKPYNMFVTRHQYLEESIHYNIINDSELKELVYDKFHQDYEVFDVFRNSDDGSIKSFNIRYDHYWQNIMNGKI